MQACRSSLIVTIAIGLLAPLALIGCTNAPVAPAAAAAAPAPGPQAVATVDMGDYEVVKDWPKPLPDDDLDHEGWTWGSGAGVFVESPDKVWVAQRSEIQLPEGFPAFNRCACLLDPPRTNTGRRPYSGQPYGYEQRRHHLVFAVDAEGYAIEEWLHLDDFFFPEGSVARGPHKLKISPYDPERHVWIIDDELHEIHKFTNDGELVFTLGERGVPGRGPDRFNRPTDIVWLPDGTFFIADGYAGTRVAKFDADGEFITDWGQPPADADNPGPGEFWSVHSIDVSNDRRLFVADREHHRMQVYDEDGNFLDMWPTGYNSAVLTHYVSADDYVWVADWTTDRMVKYTLDGRYVLDIGEHGPLPGQFDGVHQIHVDQDGNLYVTEVANDRSQKFVPKPDADPAKLVGPPVGGWPQ